MNIDNSGFDVVFVEKLIGDPSLLLKNVTKENFD